MAENLKYNAAPDNGNSVGATGVQRLLEKGGPVPSAPHSLHFLL